MGMDFRGDPSSALLEVLDPEQNSTFMDHYLEIEYDLSNVMFVTTANTLNIPPALMDRMEIIRIAGYTEDEKVEIANTVTSSRRRWSITGSTARSSRSAEDAMLELIRRYTREAGVRNLEREINSLARKAVKELMQSQGRRRRSRSPPKKLGDLSGVAEVPLWRGRARGSGRRGHRPGLDRSRAASSSRSKP